MATESLLRLGVPDGALLERLITDPLPLGLRAGRIERRFHRDVYFDTPDGALAERGVTCRLRIDSTDRRVLSVRIREHSEHGEVIAQNRYMADVPDAEPQHVFAGSSEPARILRAIVDPGRLAPFLELETDRHVRVARRGILWGGWFEFSYDEVTARAGDLTATFCEVVIRRLRDGRPHLEELEQAFGNQYGVAPVLADRLARGRQLLDTLEVEVLERSLRASREVAVLPFDFGRIGLTCDGQRLKVPIGSGGGEEAARRVLRELFGTGQAQVRFLGTAPAVGTRPVLEVWLARRIPFDPEDERARCLEWPTVPEAVALAGTPAVRDARTLAALHVAARSDLMEEQESWRSPPGQSPGNGNGRRRSFVPVAIRDPILRGASLDPDHPVPEQFINQNLSFIAFHARVLALAEDESLPLLERVRFLAIFSANMDEFFMVRVGKRKREIAEGWLAAQEDGLTPGEELDAIAIRARELFARAHRLLREDLVPALGGHGIHIVRWSELSDDQRTYLRRHFREQVYPVLTPLATSPGHPFPHIPTLRIALAAMVRDPESGVEHFAVVRVPETLPRFVRLPESKDVVALEAVICANMDALFPGLEVIRAHSFRVTRSGDVRYDEDRARDLLQEIEEEVQKRPYSAVVRMEVERTMPRDMRDLLVQEFRFESRDEPSTLVESDLYDVDWLTDLAGLKEIAALDVAELKYPPFRGRALVPQDVHVFDAVRERDVLAHHPYDAFEGTVERFLVEAARDPDVLAIKVSLYRTNDRPRVVEALIEAAERGKQVVVLVELKARYDEERNIRWARRLEGAGIHVVYGLLGLKTHAKIALVVRREGERLQRYVLVGTGNLNAVTAGLYTDLALLTARETTGGDLHTLFNALSGYAAQTEYGELIVSPRHMLRRFVELIEREAEHAARGRGGLIRVKLNGLADTEIIRALYRASQAGVEADLIVRGICRLRPGVRGLSERIRVVSILGRFLEHARIFHFANGGADEYYIGSADWRGRNLRRRVEVVAPVVDPACRDRLDRILRTELADPAAWDLKPDGSYVRRCQRAAECESAQDVFMAEATEQMVGTA